MTIPDVQQANANIVIDNLVTVSNGQEPSSVSMTGKVLEFPDATLMMRDPQGAKVIVVSQKTQDDQKTPIIIDNLTADFSIAGVKKIELPTTEILAKGGGVYALTPYVTVGQQEGGTDDVLARRITAQRPLQVQKQSGGTAVVGIDPAFLEKEHVSYYAYLDQEEEISPKRKSIGDASLWFDDSGAVTPIAGADLRVKISANSKGSIVNLKADTFDVSAGDCVGIQVKSDKVDGCFLESTTPSQPLVLTTIEYVRIV